MGDFRRDLFFKLAASHETKPDPNLPDDAPIGPFGFTNVQIADIERFKNELFRLVMLRARNHMQETNQDAKPENERIAFCELNVIFVTDDVHGRQHSDPTVPEVRPQGGVPESILPSIFDDRESTQCLRTLYNIGLACDL